MSACLETLKLALSNAEVESVTLDAGPADTYIVSLVTVHSRTIDLGDFLNYETARAYATKASRLFDSCVIDYLKAPSDLKRLLTERLCHNYPEGKPGMYLHLFHGRTDPSEDMDEWGLQGPLLGPLQSCHITYSSSIQLTYADGVETGPLLSSDPLRFEGDLIFFEGLYYGDWAVSLIS